ncbi:MAG TPA: response regulator [Candidatus Acidoferrales bacterium]|nr:response regulator [Candidatus Acidoferrales bacterium]
MPRLLIVDDDDAMRKVLRFRLKNSYEIIDTGSPEEALALALQQKPDAILLDLMMPKYSGFEVCQAISSISFTQMIPIFIVSGESAQRYRDFCKNLGAKGYFQKPINFEELEGRLAAVLGDKRVDRRSETRVKLRVILKLKGTDAKGQPFELLTPTDNVNAHGFLCGCTATLEKHAVVDVSLMSVGQHLVGKAEMIHNEWPDTPGQTCGFHFNGEPFDWVLR